MRNLQLAKAAVAAGISVLLAAEGITVEKLDGVYLAGGFGSYLDPKSAVKIGMLPYLPPDKLHNTGNTALAGASMMTLDTEKIGCVRKIAQGCDYIELSGRADFAAAFAENIAF